MQESGRVLNKVILRIHLCAVSDTALPDKLCYHSDPGSGSSSTEASFGPWANGFPPGVSVS